MTRPTRITDVVNEDELDAHEFFARALRQLELADKKGHGWRGDFSNGKKACDAAVDRPRSTRIRKRSAR
jgi:hypothetical protein